MARKLKSDKVLFIATILLVALSIVMVYSASAPMAMERYGRASRFLITQAMWSVLGIAMLSVVMRIDYRFYKEPTFIWAALLERRMHRIDEVTYSVLPIAIVVLGLVALILPEPDFGTSMSILLVAAVMVFEAGLNYRYVIGAILCALPAIYFVVMGSAYRRCRTLAFLNPWED